MITLKRTDSDNPDFRFLVGFLNAELSERDGEDHSFYAQFNKVDMIKHVVLAYNNGEPVGCGAIKAYQEGIAEVKRTFVPLASRKAGHSCKSALRARKMGIRTGLRCLHFRNRQKTTRSHCAVPKMRLLHYSQLRAVRRCRQ